MNERDEQIKELELSMEQAKALIEMRADILELIKTPLWKKVIDKEYFHEEPHRLVLLKADPNMQESEKQTDLDRQIIAIGELWQWLKNRLQLGWQAEKSLDSANEARDEILDEEPSLEN